VDTNSVTTNYTGTVNVILHPSATPPWDTDYFDIEFVDGITYADFISLNITMTVDYLGTEMVGAGVVNSSVVMYPICKLGGFLNPITSSKYPLDAEDYLACGPMAAVDVMTEIPGAMNN
jgi:hypothetical protein